MTNTVMTSLCGFILCHILNVVLCIPLTEFYPFGKNDTEGAIKLNDGHNVYTKLFVDEVIWFYGQSYDTLIVSLISTIPS